MSYHDTIAYLDSFINYEKKSRYPYKESFKLERIREFLGRIGDPQEGLRYIHVAGTKGKGSVCVFTASMLRQLGYSVGLYTSPHLVDVRERLRVLRPHGAPANSGGRLGEGDDFEGMISEGDLMRLTARLRPEIDAYGKVSTYGQLSFFEVYTALAFLYFKEQAVDYAILETGLGGRLDATNVVQPHIVGITSISYDHMNKLGSTLSDIAKEKSGIIKPKTSTGLVISALQQEDVRAVLRARCEEQGASLYEVGRDIAYESVSASQQDQLFDIRGIFGDYKAMRLPFLGEHQLMNASVSVGLVAGALGRPCDCAARDAMRAGLSKSRWPGRFEIFGNHPGIVLDGAHNEASAQVLAQTLRGFISEGSPGAASQGGIILVLGVSKDKDFAGICKHLIPIAKQCIVTRADNPRALRTSEIAGRLKAGGIQAPVVEAQRVPDALDIALKSAGANDTIVVTGSLFIVGEARQVLTSKNGLNR
jgi:dihydrofolate synthase/folylpolyglutamate synthase